MRITAADCADNFGTEAMSPPTTAQTSNADLKLHPKAPRRHRVGPNACEFANMKRVMVRFRKAHILFD
jgi:hypothetical protein